MLKKLLVSGIGKKSRALQIFYCPNISSNFENGLSKCSVFEKFQPNKCTDIKCYHILLRISVVSPANSVNGQLN